MRQPYEIANRLMEHSEIDNVRADMRRIKVAHVPDDRHAERFPPELVEYIEQVIEDSMFKFEYGEPHDNQAEKHSVTGGVHHNAICAENTELHIDLVK